MLRALADWVRDRTMIVVTHRPQILMLVDRIIVMEQGQIVMDGPKQAVLDRLSGRPATPPGAPATQPAPVAGHGKQETI